MSENSINQKRINQWFIRGIGIVVTGIFVTVITFSLMSLQDGLFHTASEPSEAIDFIIVSKRIGRYLWTFRVFDLILIVVILLLTLIFTNYLLSFKSDMKKQERERRRHRF